MNWFTVRFESVSDDQLRTVLFDFVATGNAREVEQMVREHRDRIRALFPTWKTPPPDVRSDPRRTAWWSTGAVGVAAAAEACGDRSLMALLLEAVDR